MVVSVATGSLNMWHRVLHISAVAVDLAWHEHGARAAHGCSVLCAGTHVWVQLARASSTRSCCGAPCTPRAVCELPWGGGAGCVCPWVYVLAGGSHSQLKKGCSFDITIPCKSSIRHPAFLCSRRAQPCSLQRKSQHHCGVSHACTLARAGSLRITPEDKETQVWASLLFSNADFLHGLRT